MKLWRGAVWVGALALMAPLVLMAWSSPMYIGVILCAGVAYRASDLVRLRTKQLDRALLAFDLADLLDLGVPLAEAAGRLAEEQKQDWRVSRTSLAVYWARVADALARGSTLAQCVGRSRHFPQVWGAALASVAGQDQLPDVLRRLGHLEMLEAERRRDHLWLPTLMLVFLLGVLFFLVTYIWPTFFTIFEGAEVPAPTSLRWLNRVVKALRNPAGGPLLILGFWGVVYLVRRLTWRFNRPRVLAEQAGMAEVLACGADLGLSVPRLLDLASTACGQPYRKELKELSGGSGDTLAQALSRGKLLPATWLWFIGQGEARGELAEALHKTALELHAEQRRVAQRWHVVASQVSIAGLGLVVGLTCFASMTCLMELNRLLVEVL